MVGPSGLMRKMCMPTFQGVFEFVNFHWIFYGPFLGMAVPLSQLVRGAPISVI